MLKTDLPNLSMMQYDRANQLRDELCFARTTLEIYGANPALTAMLSAGAGGGAGTTTALIASGVKLTGVAITGTGTFFTPTIVNGVLTGGVLSAS